MNLSVLIVDDERLSRSYIRDLILEFEPGINIYEAKSGQTAKPILEEGIIDILFLDIKMTGMDGFELLSTVSHRNFELVFITAYNEFAIKAIKEGAVDYLLKPIKKAEFKTTLARVIEKRRNVSIQKKAVPGLANDKEQYLSQKLVLNHHQGIKFVTLRDIVYFRADNSYTIIHLSSGEKITVSKAISKFELKLDQPYFFRIHKSYIIGLHHFKEYISKDGDIALMDNGDKIFISRYRLSAFLDQVKSMSGELKI